MDITARRLQASLEYNDMELAKLRNAYERLPIYLRALDRVRNECGLYDSQAAITDWPGVIFYFLGDSGAVKKAMGIVVDEIGYPPRMPDSIEPLFCGTRRVRELYKSVLEEIEISVERPPLSCITGLVIYRGQDGRRIKVRRSLLTGRQIVKEVHA